MIQLTNREKCLAGALLLSILVGVTVRHCRHRESGAPKGSQTIPAAGPKAVSRDRLHIPFYAENWLYRST